MPPPASSRAIASGAHSVAAANLFMQFAPHPRSAPKPVLDFLWPRAGIIAKRTHRNHTNGSDSTSARPRTRTRAPSTLSTRRTTASSRSTSCWGGASTTTAIVAPATPRTVFTAFTSARRYTQAVFNPQKDDDGNEMKLEITPRAAKRLSDIMRKDANPNLALRVQVESGGCHGFQYLMSLVTLPESLPSTSSPSQAAAPSEHPGEGAESGAIREDDTIFTYVPEEMRPAGTEVAGAPKIILDQPSLELLKGSKVDFTMELIGSQFKIVDNPLATSSCGCGTSFDIKF